MNTLEGRAWQALAAVKGIGSRALWQVADYLFSREKTASWLLRNPGKAAEALRGIRGGIELPDPGILGRGEEEGGDEREATVLHPLHPAFPRRLRERRGELTLPPLLYAAGNLALLERAGVAVVGRRDAGAQALAAAEGLAARLAGGAIHVISGYAAGVDSAAHLGALRAGGTTTLVLAEGLDHFRLKPGFSELLNDENGLVLSPFHPGARWAAFQAMARNKVVAALAAAVVVVAAGPERDADGRMSGSFDTGRTALRLGLPLFVAEPAAFDPPPAGNGELIRRGGRPWDPAAGAGPVLEAVKAAAKRKGPEQGSLF